VAASQGEVSSSGRTLESRLGEAMDIRGLLLRNTEEADGVVRALNGEYILPEAGGDLLRDGAGVLPTGADFHPPPPPAYPTACCAQDDHHHIVRAPNEATGMGCALKVRHLLSDAGGRLAQRRVLP